jgi:hypothetical protein
MPFGGSGHPTRERLSLRTWMGEDSWKLGIHRHAGETLTSTVP